MRASVCCQTGGPVPCSAGRYHHLSADHSQHHAWAGLQRWHPCHYGQSTRTWCVIGPSFLAWFCLSCTGRVQWPVSCLNWLLALLSMLSWSVDQDLVHNWVIFSGLILFVLYWPCTMASVMLELAFSAAIHAVMVSRPGPGAYLGHLFWLDVICHVLCWSWALLLPLSHGQCSTWADIQAITVSQLGPGTLLSCLF